MAKLTGVEAMLNDCMAEQKQLLEELAIAVTTGNLDLQTNEHLVHQILNTAGGTLIALRELKNSAWSYTPQKNRGVVSPPK